MDERKLGHPVGPACLRWFQCVHFVSTYKRIETGRNGSTKSDEIRVIATFYLAVDRFGLPTPQTGDLVLKEDVDDTGDRSVSRCLLTQGDPGAVYKTLSLLAR